MHSVQRLKLDEKAQKILYQGYRAIIQNHISTGFLGKTAPYS